MQNTHSKTALTSLESVVQQFQHWREMRSNKREKMPDSLLALAKPLLGQYSRNKIASALRISYAQLKRALPAPLPSQPPPSSFVECALPAPFLSTEPCRIEFTCKTGSAVKISGLTSPQLQALVSLLMGS